MSTLIFIHGPNGVGKSTVCRTVHGRLAHSAWLESEWCRMTNPFAWNEALIALTIHNMAHLLRGYLSCEWIDYVLFPYGFHGPRQHIWDTVYAGVGFSAQGSDGVTGTYSCGTGIYQIDVVGGIIIDTPICVDPGPNSVQAQIDALREEILRLRALLEVHR